MRTRPSSPEAAVRNHNIALAARDKAEPGEDPLAPYDLQAPENRQRLEKDLRDRLKYMRERIADARYVDAAGKKLTAAQAAPFAEPKSLPAPGRTVHRALADTPLRCGPVPAPLFKGPTPDPKFDRNSCSTIRKGELVRVISPWSGGTQLARTRYAMGWIAADAKLSPPLAADAVANVRATPKAITRRAVIEKAFSYLGTPYGWGGQQGGRDCSRFLMDVFGSFGLDLPRHSGLQAKAGSMSVDVSKVKGLGERLATIDAAHERGIVLLHFPGHIMLYLGRSQEGTPMVIHAFAEYLEPCASDDGETLRTVDQIQVSDLSLGKGTSRTSFLKRITRITVIGSTPGQKLLGAVERRVAAPMAPSTTCKDSEQVSITISPRRPHQGAPVRVLVSSSHDLGAAGIQIFGASGAQHVLAVRTTGGPPFGYWAEVAGLPTGSWAAQIGDGETVAACKQLIVHEKGDQLQASGGIAWRPRQKWTESTENLYSTWVEQLFDYPLDDRTWNNLQGLLKNRDNNILYNHLGQGEDDQLHLQPDCADLPYFLRAYFAWEDATAVRVPSLQPRVQRQSSILRP